MAIEYFCCYHSYLEAMEQLNDAERGRLFTACLTYSKTGEAPELRGNERFVFPAFRSQIDRDNANYEEKCKKQSEKARKRWDAKASTGMPKNATASQSMPKDANDAKEKEKEKEKAKTKAKEKERDIYGEYANVRLTKAELLKLQEEFPVNWNTLIERLSGYMASTGKKYVDHLATMRNWGRKDNLGGNAPVKHAPAKASSGGNVFLELLEDGDFVL